MREISLKLGSTLIEAVVVLVDGSTVNIDASLGNIFYLNAEGDRTLAAPTNPIDGQKIIIRHYAAGANRTLSLASGAGGFSFGTTIIALSSTASGTSDYIGCIYNGSTNLWNVLAYAQGF